MISLSVMQSASLIEELAGSYNTSITFTSSLITDIFNNAVVPRSDSNPKATDIFVPDETSPSVSSFDLDMNNGVADYLPIRGSEDCLVSRPLLITIQDAASRVNGYNFSSNSTAVLVNSRELQVTLSSADLFGVRAALDTATNVNNTFMVVTGALISDLYNNSNMQILDGAALQVSNFTADSIDPELLSFTFGEYDGQVTLSLTFTEVIDASSVTSNQLTLQSASSLTVAGTQFYMLTSTPNPTVSSNINSYSTRGR